MAADNYAELGDFCSSTPASSQYIRPCQKAGKISLEIHVNDPL